MYAHHQIYRIINNVITSARLPSHILFFISSHASLSIQPELVQALLEEHPLGMSVKMSCSAIYKCRERPLLNSALDRSPLAAACRARRVRRPPDKNSLQSTKYNVDLRWRRRSQRQGRRRPRTYVKPWQLKRVLNSSSRTTRFVDLTRP